MEAKLSFEKALKEAKSDLNFYDLLDKKSIEYKIKTCDDYKYVKDLMDLATSQADLGQTERALATYQNANKEALRSDNREAQKEILLKSEALKSKLLAENAMKTDKEKADEQLKKDGKIKRIQTDELDGDKALTEEDFAKATSVFNKAIADYTEMGELEKASAVSKKLADVSGKIKLQDETDQIFIAEAYIEMGDNYLAENKFSEALDSYQTAKDLYASMKKPELVVKANESISQVKSKIKESENTSKVLEAGIIEGDGDKLLAEKDYFGAKEKYRQAQALYQGLNQSDKILTVEDKVKAIDKIIVERQAAIDQANAEQASANPQASDKPTSDKEKAKAARDKLIYDAKSLELSGDQAVVAKKYGDALEYYKNAKVMFQEAAAYDEALAVQKKIYEVESKKNGS